MALLLELSYVAKRCTLTVMMFYKQILNDAAPAPLHPAISALLYKLVWEQYPAAKSDLMKYMNLINEPLFS